MQDTQKFTRIKINPDGDGYDLIFLNGKLAIQGDYYHDKTGELFKGMKILCDLLELDYIVEEAYYDVKNPKESEWTDYDYMADIDQTLESYLKQISKDYKQFNY